jgi:S1-C subfamily serine protease
MTSQRVLARRRTKEIALSLILGFLIVGTATSNAQNISESENSKHPRRATLLKGLEDLEQSVDFSEPWFEQVKEMVITVRPSTVVVSNASHPDWPPLTGFVISSRHVLTAHLTPLPDGGERPFLIRTLDGRILNGRQVDAWQEWDFGVIEMDKPLDLPVVTFGDERQMSSGDLVFMVQHPDVQSRTGLFITNVGTFSKASSARCWAALSTSHGGSGSAIFNIRGEVIGMSTTGKPDPRFSLGVRDIGELFVSELRLRNTLPVDRGGTIGGVGGTKMANLTAVFREQ